MSLVELSNSAKVNGGVYFPLSPQTVVVPQDTATHARLLAELILAHGLTFESNVANPYSKGGLNIVPAQSKLISADNLVRVLLSVCAALIVFIFLSVKSEVSDLKTEAKEINRTLIDAKVELLKAVGSVREQSAATNARLDQLIIDGKQRGGK